MAKRVEAEYESVSEVAQRTGYSTWTIRNLINTGKLPAYRINNMPGASLRVKRADVDALFTAFIPEPVAITRRVGA